MPSLKDLRNRIASVKATQKITKAMQMVAAAKLRRAQSSAEAARPYAERMGVVLSNLAGSIAPGAGGPGLLTGTGQDSTHLLVVCTAERGLCGGFNTSIVRLAREHAAQLLAQGKKVKIICVGKKGYDQLKRNYESHIIELIELRAVKNLAFSNADPIGRKIVALFHEGEFDVCTLFFSRFKSVIAQIPTALQLIPADVTTGGDKAAGTGHGAAAQVGSVNYDFEPDESEILADLLPRNISVQVFRALLENAASEQGARMSAMDNATRNAGEMIKKQTTKYNRSRQAMITKELIEIISGAEAL
ncbi:MAG: F0F1 ATP synthase subunit gamma [Hyphomicrobiales bacterium]|nr:F0F1 ATP synthase subunit gamma [Hyphomicrobiales bacterium]